MFNTVTIGQGTYGKVVCQGSSCKATKIMRRSLTSTKEFQISMLITHPNISKGYLSTENKKKDEVYMTMERYPGTLVGFRNNDWKYFMWKTLSTFSELNDNGIYHRDIKPENIMYEVMRDGSVEPMIIDFGLATVVRNNYEDRGSIVYTYPYRAPEINYKAIKGKESIDWNLADAYAIGMTLLQWVGFQFVESWREVNLFKYMYDEYGVQIEQEIRKEPKDREYILQEFFLEHVKYSGQVGDILSYMPDGAARVISNLIALNMYNRKTISEVLDDPYFSEFTPKSNLVLNFATPVTLPTPIKYRPLINIFSELIGDELQGTTLIAQAYDLDKDNVVYMAMCLYFIYYNNETEAYVVKKIFPDTAQREYPLLLDYAYNTIRNKKILYIE